MLGLADRTQLFDLYDLLMRGDAKGALDLMGALYAAGADPAVVVQDLLELTHWLTRIKLAPQAAEAPGVPEAERVRGGAMAGKLTLAHLARVWQDAAEGPRRGAIRALPPQAAEMVVIRLTHAADLPTPADLVRQLQDGGGAPAERPRGPVAAERTAPTTTAFAAAPTAPARSEPSDRPRALPPAAHVAAAQTEPAALAPNPESFADIVTLLGERREAILQAHLKNNVHLVRFEPGRLSSVPTSTRRARWPTAWAPCFGVDRPPLVVAISGEPGEPTLTEQEAATDRRERAEATAHPLVQAALAAFPAPPSRRSAISRRPPSQRLMENQRHEESRPDDEAGPGHAGQDAGDAGRARAHGSDRRSPAAAWSPSPSPARARCVASRSIPS